MQNFQAIFDNALKLAARREHLGRNAIPCPKCNTRQIQLVDHICMPAKWKCRECRHKFDFEPNEFGAQQRIKADEVGEIIGRKCIPIKDDKTDNLFSGCGFCAI